MDSGIYQLTFANGDTYVGKSLQLSTRWKQHTDKLSKGTAAKNMMQAYWNSDHEYPTAHILLECHADVLDEYENLFINNLQPTLNTQRPRPRTEAERAALVRHAEAGNAIYSMPTIIMALENVLDERNQAQAEVEELEETVEAWEDRAIFDLRKGQHYRELEANRDSLAVQVSELQEWKGRVIRANWWQRLFCAW